MTHPGARRAERRKAERRVIKAAVRLFNRVQRAKMNVIVSRGSNSITTLITPTYVDTGPLMKAVAAYRRKGAKK